MPSLTAEYSDRTMQIWPATGGETMSERSAAVPGPVNHKARTLLLNAAVVMRSPANKGSRRERDPLALTANYTYGTGSPQPMRTVPRILVCDIDGVLTDGSVWIDGKGNELKRISFHDLDALFDLERNGFTLGFLTGEQGDWVEMIKKRLPYKYFYPGCRDKRSALLEILRLENGQSADLCYIGDGLSDVPALQLAGVAAVPANAVQEARSVAGIVLSASGGQGAIVELAHILKAAAD